MGAVERQAEKVLGQVPAWIWDGASTPVPVETIADSVYGLHVRDIADLSTAPGAPPAAPGQSLSGLLLVGRREIWVNAEEARQWPPRRRFTIGHELGHWILHRTGRHAVFCRSTSVAAGEQGEIDGGLPEIEAQAHAFAAAVLMPARIIQAVHDEVDGDVDELCGRFGSSRAAMVRRLADVLGD
ncbi:MAG: ImmA/IrrE family metallo-endopeptidase [Thermoleophilaceae bacterium]